MKICYLADAESIHTQRWIKYFADKGHDIFLISVPPSFDFNIQNVKLYEFKYKKMPVRVLFVSSFVNALSALYYLRRLLKLIKPDILHIHYIANYTLPAALMRPCPFVVSPWGSDVLIASKESKRTERIIKYVIQRSDLITCDGENLKAEIVRLGAHPKKIEFIYFGVDMQKFSPQHREEKFRKEMGIFNSPVTISIRSLTPDYNIESLVKAIPLVLGQIPNAKFIIAGDGEQKDYLKNLAVSLKVSESVKFVGWIPHDKLPKYLALADVYVSTALSDGGISVSTLEAMACRLPVVITDTGDNKRWVKDGINGFIVPVKSPDALASKIINLLKNKHTRERFARINRQIVEEKASYKKEMRKMEKLYKGLLKRYER